MASLDARLMKLEWVRRSQTGDAYCMTDEQLAAVVRRGLRELQAKDHLTEQERRDLALFKLAMEE